LLFTNKDKGLVATGRGASLPCRSHLGRAVSSPQHLRTPITSAICLHSQQHSNVHQMTSTNPSNIRVTVTFAQSTVFAGEDVVATITFKNITTVALPKRQVTPVERQRRFAPIQGNSGGRGDGAIRNGLRGGIGEGGRGRGRGHRPTLSLSTHTAQGVQTVTNEAAGTSGRVRPRHSRSISIVSLGGEHNKGRGRGVPGHTRSSSVQVGRTSFSSKAQRALCMRLCTHNH